MIILITKGESQMFTCNFLKSQCILYIVNSWWFLVLVLIIIHKKK